MTPLSLFLVHHTGFARTILRTYLNGYLEARPKMDSALLAAPFEPAALEEADTSRLKHSLLKLVEGKDTEPIATKVRFANETLMPLFDELEKRNPTPELSQQIPLLKGVWSPVWSTIPFQDILPGRVHHESYQIFSDDGYYANLARYKPGHKRRVFSWLSRWLLSYDLMIVQRYSVQTQAISGSTNPLVPNKAGQDYWDIQNISIQQALHFGSSSFSAQMAQAWFDKAVIHHKSANLREQALPVQQQANRVTPKQYQQISKARPRLENLYIDREFRLVKTQREKTQRPSYTVTIRY